MQHLFIIAGPNGAGKTTASFTVLPDMLNCKEFVNADEIARGLSPFQAEKVAIDAGRLMLQRINELIRHKSEFAFETTLSTRSYVNLISKAKESGYFVTLVYFWLNSPNLAIERVKARVLEGGHDIPVDVIKRRYNSGIKNLFNLYIPISDYWMIIDNSENPFKLIAEGNSNIDKQIHDNFIWDKIKHNNYGK
ncbi:MAG TPA: zeta toxin family protein [Bacteroidales bacterium]|nr:zeta toxin family protein [Bacteroidales bacterium]HQI45439.1 zeta toxin family protein [Bacteroidales bacterium]